MARIITYMTLHKVRNVGGFEMLRKGGTTGAREEGGHADMAAAPELRLDFSVITQGR